MSSAHPKFPKERLLIGEVARLLGITPKAIRHYEKLGLLDEPERSESGYRLYTASDLLRLHRISKLRTLGLSLRRIESILGDGDCSIEFEGVVEALLGEIEAQIGNLERRRADLRRMLKDEVAVHEEIPLPEEEPYAFTIFREHLGERWDSLDSQTLGQMREFWSTLDAFEWPRGYSEFQENLALYMAEHPGECERILVLEERLATLAQLPEDASEVEILAGDYAASSRRARYSRNCSSVWAGHTSLWRGWSRCSPGSC